MISFKSIGIAVAIGLVVLMLGAFVTGDHGPGGALIRAAMAKDVAKRGQDAHLIKLTFIRAGSFVPEAHRQVPKGTTFYPIRATATYTHDGETTQGTRTLYFYRDRTGKWVYEVNSF